MVEVKSSKLYNEHIKERFLETYPEQTRPGYRRIFITSKRTEELLGKDLYDFSLEEIEDVLHDLSPTTFSASQTNGRIVTAYISWAIQEGLRQNNINPLRIVDPQYFTKFVDPTLNMFFTEKKLREIEDQCVNAQDYAIFRLLFEGVNGSRLSEIRNLKKADVDSDNLRLTLTDADGSQRVIDVSPRAISFVEKAAKETVYYKKNGEPIDNEKVRPYTDLVDNEYVFRSSITRTEHYGMVDIHLIYRRINMVKELFEIPFFTSTNIAKSGMIYMAKELVKRDGDLLREHYLMIADRFKVNNWYSIKEYVNMDNIKKLYGDELA